MTADENLANPYESPPVLATLISSESIDWEGRTLNFLQTVDDYVELNLHVQRKNPRFRLQAAVIQVVAFLVMIPAAMFFLNWILPARSDTESNLLAWFTLLLIVILSAVAIYRTGRKGVNNDAAARIFRKVYEGADNAPLFGPRQIRLTSDYVYTTSDYSDARFKMTALQRIAVSRRNVFLFLAASMAILIPRQAFSTLEDEAAFVDFVAKHSGAPVERD